MLLWLAEDSQYLWQQETNKGKRGRSSAQDDVFRMLDEFTSFSFQGQQGHLTLLKETRVRGSDGYWYAYRRQGKRVEEVRWIAWHCSASNPRWALTCIVRFPARLMRRVVPKEVSLQQMGCHFLSLHNV